MTFRGQKRPPALRLVYDGSPEAGKTTSLMAMARAFEELVVVPEEEDGRTVFFDWLEHTVAAPDGRTYRMQVVSVPGQARWGARRAHLVSLAHVILFVADTRSTSWRETRERWLGLLATRAESAARDIPIVFQANKRDCEGAVPLEEIRSVVPNGIPIMESSAARDVGVKEAFWEGVRLAAGRVTDEPDEEADELDQPQVLLDRLIALDATTDQLRFQASSVRDGFVWPPVEGRALLREALGVRSELRVVDRGTYGFGPGLGWRVFSPEHAVFPTLAESRTALVAWARAHARLGRSLSPRRCIVVLETTGGQFRLWQLVHRETTVGQLLAGQVTFAGAATPVERLIRAALYVRAVRAHAAETGVLLPCSFETVGWSGQAPHFVGLMPYPLVEPEPESWDELAWEVETFLVHDTGGLRADIEASITHHHDDREREYLRAVFGDRA